MAADYRNVSDRRDQRVFKTVLLTIMKKVNKIITFSRLQYVTKKGEGG